MLRGSGVHTESSRDFTWRSRSAFAFRSILQRSPLYFSSNSSALNIDSAGVVISISLSERDESIIEVDHDLRGQKPLAHFEVVTDLGVVLVGHAFQCVLDVLDDVVEVRRRRFEDSFLPGIKRMRIKDQHPQRDRTQQHWDAS